MPINEDHDYENDGFGIEAVFDVNGTDLNVFGHFTDATEAVSMFTGELEANDASFTCNTSEVGTVKNGMTVEIDGVTFTVKRKQRIGTGDTLFYLKT